MVLKDIQESALALPDSDRASLAAELLISLPAVLVEEDGGIGEAIRRSRELDENPNLACSWDDIKLALGRNP